MKVLLCGATGFIGRHVQAALNAAGHEVVSCSSAAAPQPNRITVDFAQDTQPQTWLPRLGGIDAVINAVGVLRDTRRRPIHPIHTATPIALATACAQAGIRRFVQVSALGIEGSPTQYARTKLAAEEHLLKLTDADQLDAVILRPSIVFSRGGDSSQLFMNLARLPALLLPQAVLSARVQPVAVTELADVVAKLVSPDNTVAGVLPCVGPQATTLGDFIASLRLQQGRSRAWVAPLPDALTRLSARLGDAVPASPWCSESLAMLAQDNVSDPRPFQAVLGRTATPYDQLLQATWR